MSNVIEPFLNALQLSIPILIVDSIVEPDTDNILEIHFSENAEQEPHVQTFVKMLQPNISWLNQSSLEWADATTMNVTNMTELLILTRLNKQNLKKMAELDSKFKPWVNKLNLEKHQNKNFSDLLFSQSTKQHMTQTELAKKSNLSLVSLYKFKNGGDIRLSNFLKMLDALNLEMVIKERK